MIFRMYCPPPLKRTRSDPPFKHTYIVEVQSRGPQSGATFFLCSDSDPLPFKRTFHGKRGALKRGEQHLFKGV